MYFFLPRLICFIPVAVHICFFFLPCSLFYMIDVFSHPLFFPSSFYSLRTASTGNPVITLCQHFLPCCFLGQDIFPTMFTAELHNWLYRIERIPLQTDAQSRIILAQPFQQSFGRIELTIILADILVLILILSRLVDTFSSRILYLMLLLSVYHSIAVVLASEADLHWWSKSSGYSSS